MNTSSSKKITALTIVFLGMIFFASYAEALTLSPARFELSGDPGETVPAEVVLMNESEGQATYYSSFSNFEASGETGSPNLVEPTEGLGTWMSTQSSVNLGPAISAIVPFTISIPQNAEPGGYFGAVCFGTADPKADTAGVSIGAKTCVLVLLKVNGEIKEGGGILEFGTKDNIKFFTSLPVSFVYRFQNTGGDRIKPEGDITIKHFIGFIKARVPANMVEGNVLPAQTRKFEATWQSKNGSDAEYATGFIESVKREWQNFAFGYYHANLALSYGENNLQISQAKTGFWVLPWHLLLTLAVLFFAIRFIWKRVKRHHKISMMSEMREEIKREIEQERKATNSGMPPSHEV